MASREIGYSVQAPTRVSTEIQFTISFHTGLTIIFHLRDIAEPVTRKKSLVKLLDLQCEAIKNQKMTAYKKSLLAKREKLLKEFSQNPV